MSAQLPPEIIQRLEELKGIQDDFLQRNDERFSALRGRISDLEMHRNRQGLGGGWQGDEDRTELDKGLRAYIRNGDASGIREKSMAAGDDSSGGYFVPHEMSRGILETIFQSSPIRQVSKVVKISSDAYEEPESHSDLGAAWVEETGARTETTTPEIGKIRIPAHECYANPAVTQKLLDDSAIDLAGWLEERIGGKFGRMEAAAFVSGDGISKPRGFLSFTTAATSDATRSWGVLEHVASGASANFASTNPGDALISLVFALKAGYRRGATWLMNSKTLAATRKLKDGQGNYLWQQSVTVGQPDLLLGYPVLAAEDMPDIAANSLSIAFGNFAFGYCVVDRFPLRMLRDELTHKPFVHFYTFRRVGGDVVNFEAIKVMKFATSYTRGHK